MLDPGLLAAIIANPKNDDIRLIAADWLDEHGECDRAEFIRVQVELSQTKEPELKSIGIISDYESRRAACSGCRSGPPGTDCRWCVLRGRERGLLEKHGVGWALDLVRPAGIDVGGPRRWLEPTRIINRYSVGLGRWQAAETLMSWDYTRGFISAITLSADDWLRHADAITAATPIERVTITGWPEYLSVPAIFAEMARHDPIAYFGERWPRIKFTLPGREIVRTALNMTTGERVVVIDTTWQGQPVTLPVGYQWVEGQV